MGNYRFDIEENFVRVWLEGVIKSDDVTNLMSLIVKEKKKLPGILRILIDSRRASFDSKPSDVEHVRKRLVEHSEKFEEVRIALILHGPFETALSMLLSERLLKNENIGFKVFSTEKAAINWLI